MNSNKVYRGNDDFIHVDVIGEQDHGSLKEVKRQLEELAKTQRFEDKPVKIFGDLTKMTKQDSGARKSGYDIIALLDYDKIAVFGASPFLKNVANLIAKFSKKTDIVKFFDSKREAESWLGET